MCVIQGQHQSKEDEERHHSLCIGSICAVVSAICFVVAIIAGVSEFGVAAAELDFIGDPQHAKDRRMMYENLNTTSLKKLWKFRIETQYATAFLDVILAVAWFMALPAILTLAKLWKGQPELQLLLPSFATAVFLAVMNLCINAGVAEGTAKIASWAVMDDKNGGFGAYQALEIAYVTSRSASTWVGSIDMLLLALAGLCIGRMALRSVPMFPCWYAVLSFAVGILGLATFVLSWGYQNRVVLGFYIMCTILTTLVFLTWLVLTAMRFWKMLSPEEDDQSDEDLKVTSTDVDVEMGDEDGATTPDSPSQPVEVAL